METPRVSFDPIPFRVRHVLVGDWHGRYRWRSDITNTLFRYDSGRGWEMYYEGIWERCYNGNLYAGDALYLLHGETLFRAGEIL